MRKILQISVKSRDWDLFRTANRQVIGVLDPDFFQWLRQVTDLENLFIHIEDE